MMGRDEYENNRNYQEGLRLIGEPDDFDVQVESAEMEIIDIHGQIMGEVERIKRMDRQRIGNN